MSRRQGTGSSLAGDIARGGPAWIGPGRHFAARLDLFTPGECAAFEAALPRAGEDVERPAWLRAWDPPCAESPPWQLRRAVTAAGDRVLVRWATVVAAVPEGAVGRAAIVGSWRAFGDGLDAAELSGALSAASPAGEIVGLGRWMDAPPGDAECAPARLRLDLCRPEALVFDDPGGASAGEVLMRGAPPAPGGRAARDLSRQLALVWLSRAVRGLPFPADLDETAVVFFEDGRPALLGGGMMVVPRAQGVHLRAFLEATLEDEPEAAARALLEARGDADGPDQELLSRFRQGAAFREGGFDRYEDQLAAKALLGWRLMAAAGRPLRGEVAGFFRGLARLTRIGERLDPGHDALRDAVLELRLRRAFAGLSRRASLEDGLALAAANLEALTALPALIEKSIAEDPDPERREGTRPADGERLFAFLGCGVALALGAARAEAVLVSGLWPWVLAIGGVLGLGGVLLRGGARD